MHRIFAAFACTALACAAFLSAACERASDPRPAPTPPPASDATAQPAAAPSAEDDRDCNLQTPLVPGIPGSPGNLIVSPRNPNGDSELSALMRVFVDDLIAARAALEAGRAPLPLREVHRRMRCAWHTKEDTRNETYDALAKGYLAEVGRFDAAPDRERFNGIVQSCVACHGVFCGGPLDLIEGLFWR
jgi:hypothetical protein